MGYHINHIPRGQFGHFSKIREEYLEVEDAFEQNNPVMMLVELADLIGAIEGYTLSRHGISLESLIEMKNATARAFNDGTRTAR